MSLGILLFSGQEGKMFVASYIEVGVCDWYFSLTMIGYLPWLIWFFFELDHPHQDGILHFKVSCGHQLITFSGYDVQAVNL